VRDQYCKEQLTVYKALIWSLSNGYMGNNGIASARLGYTYFYKTKNFSKSEIYHCHYAICCYRIDREPNVRILLNRTLCRRSRTREKCVLLLYCVFAVSVGVLMSMCGVEYACNVKETIQV
jgi:hypothetical protein